MRLSLGRSRWITTDCDRLLSRATQMRGHRPLFAAIDLVLPHATLSAFVRDISSRSLGLLSNVALPCEELDIAIPELWNQRFELSARVIGSSPAYPGWYASEADLLPRDNNQAFLLWLARQMESINRRATTRQALFETAQFLPATGALQHVLIRDVSRYGIGLAHSTAINSSTGSLDCAHGEEFQIHKVWERRCGANMTISGWRFHGGLSWYFESL